MKTYPDRSGFPVVSPMMFRRLAMLGLGVFFAAAAFAQAAPGAVLISNGDFETSTQEPDWPDHWSHPKSGSSSWELEEGKRFLRINTTAPGETVLIYRVVAIPAGVKALELSLRARVIGLKCGPQPWFDARIMTDFKNSAGTKMKGAKPLTFRKDTDGWVERKVRFAVPEGAIALEVMPTLFQAYSGTFDLDEVQLTAVDPALLNPAPAR